MRTGTCHCLQSTSHQLALTGTFLQSGDQYRALSHHKGIQGQSHIQKNGSTAPIHWAVSKATPGHAGCYAVSLLESPARNIRRDKHLKMKRKLLVVGLPTVQMRIYHLSHHLTILLGDGGAPRKRSWQELSITCPDPPLIPWMRHSRELLAYS